MTYNWLVLTTVGSQNDQSPTSISHFLVRLDYTKSSWSHLNPRMTFRWLSVDFTATWTFYWESPMISSLCATQLWCISSRNTSSSPSACWTCWTNSASSAPKNPPTDIANAIEPPAHKLWFADSFVSCCHVSGAGIATQYDARGSVYVIAEQGGGAVGMSVSFMFLKICIIWHVVCII